MKSWVLHLLFWSFSFYILMRFFAGSSQVEKIDWIYTIIFITTLIIASLINLYLFIPYLLHKKRYFLYGSSLCLLLLSAAMVNYFLFDHWIDHILPGYYFISYYDYWDILKFFIVFIGTTTMLKLSKEWFSLSEAKHQLQQLENAKIEAELNALKNQVNPHFLFNSLNVLYSLVRKKAKEAPEAIIKLSDILRYVLYETNSEYVPLSKEIKLIRDYVDLQNFRINAEVHFNIQIEDEEKKITPMILLPLIENAYKHGGRTSKKKLEIIISIQCTIDKIKIVIENSIVENEIDTMDQHSGIGLENIRKRLEHYYPEKFELYIVKENDRHIVNLIIDLIG